MKSKQVEQMFFKAVQERKRAEQLMREVEHINQWRLRVCDSYNTLLTTNSQMTSNVH